MSEPEPTRTKETRKLDCALTEAEFIAHAMGLADAETKTEQLTDEAKATVKRWKERIGAERVRSRRHRRAVATRTEKRDVLCTWYADYVARQMQLRRDDTHEVVELRTMTPEEMQTSFPTTTDDRRRLPPERDQSDDENQLDG